MSEMKTSELTGAALDWAVAKCEFVVGRIKMPAFAELEKVRIIIYNQDNTPEAGGVWFSPSTDWAQGGPIIERKKINLAMERENLWVAQIFAEPYYRRVVYTASSDNPLAAAMRCFVASKLGDEVEIPEELK